jgi:hypothetical protein
MHPIYGETRKDAYRKGAIHGAATALAVGLFIWLVTGGAG